MNKKGFLLAGSLLSLSAVAVAVLTGVKANDSPVFTNAQQTNAEYTISTWEFDGWCKNAGIDGYHEQGRVFMFHSTSTGAGQGVKVRSNVKLAVILNQRDDQDDVTGAIDFTIINGMPSIVCDENLNYVNGDHNYHAWPAEYLAIYTVRIMVGDFTFTGDSDSGILYENEEYGNFTLKSFIVNATLTYATPGDDPAGNWERYDHTYSRIFNQTQTTIGDYESVNSQPHVGFKVDSIMVTYGCSY